MKLLAYSQALLLTLVWFVMKFTHYRGIMSCRSCSEVSFSLNRFLISDDNNLEKVNNVTLFWDNEITKECCLFNVQIEYLIEL